MLVSCTFSASRHSLNLLWFTFLEVRIKNGTVPTLTTSKDPFFKVFPRRIFAPQSDIKDGFMVCECQFDESVHLGMITVSWDSLYAQNLELSSQYNVQIWRNETIRVVGSQLALRSPSRAIKFFNILRFV